MSVLICCDGSERERDAILKVGRLLGPRQALVLHASTAAPDDDSSARIVADAVGVAVEAGFDASPLVVRAGPSVPDAILQAVEEHRPEVVVLASRGLSDFASALYGSVSTRVAHNSHCPVLVIPPANGEA